MLSFKEKNDIQNDKKICCNIIDFAQQLLKQQFPSVNGLQFTGYAPILENSGKWTYSLQMTRETPPSVQVHHTGHDHWVLSIQDTSGTVFLLDSKNPRQTVSASTQIQMSRIYSSNGNVIPFNLPTVQQQTNSIDCGVFAIAYAIEFCFKQYAGGKGLTFNTSVMRDHLLQCLSNKQLQPFPKVQPKKTLKLHKNTSVYINIVKDYNAKCDLPNIYDNMVSCPECDNWFHYRCATDTTKESFSDCSFVCSNCKDK